MRLRRWLSAGFLIVSSATATAEITVGHENVNGDLVVRALDRFVQFYKDDRIVGSGFLATEEGHVITAYHVVRDLGTDVQVNPRVKMFVKQPGFDTVFDEHATRAELIGLNSEYDVAVYKITNQDSIDKKKTVDPVAFGENLSVGQQIFMLGPCTGREENCFVDGVYDLQSGQGPFFYTNKPVTPGFSGGPAFNSEDGSIVGVVVTIDQHTYVTRVLSMKSVDRMLWSFGIDLLPTYREIPAIFTEFSEFLDELKLELEWDARFVESEIGDSKPLEISYEKRISSGLHPQEISVKVTPLVEGTIDATDVTILVPMDEIPYVLSPGTVGEGVRGAEVSISSQSLQNIINGRRSGFQAPPGVELSKGVKMLRVEVNAIYRNSELGTDAVDGDIERFELAYDI